tara:strand:+ start:391 stop:1005 length:615 start_codon:yes stop_codon:yes gene_type:complete
MSHVCSLLTEIEDSDLRRLFDHSEAKAREGTVRKFDYYNKSSDEFYTTVKSTVLSYIAGVATSVIGYYKDDVLCWVGWGHTNSLGKITKNTVFHNMGFLAGQDANGSRSWLYSDDFWKALKSFHDSNSVGKYIGIAGYDVKGSTAAEFSDNVICPKLYEKDTYRINRKYERVEKSIASMVEQEIEGLYLGQDETFVHTVSYLHL